MAEMNDEDINKVVVIGSGPAGWTAAIYLSRANLSPVVYAGAQIGGQLTTTTEIENFPGFPAGVDGPKLMSDMEEQARRYGTEIVYEEISSVDFTTTPLTLKSGDKEIRAHAVIICTGAAPKMMGLESEKTYWNRGVHTCAVCDGGFYRGKTVAVIGGGDSAMEEATYLAKLCKKVYVVHRRDELRASKIMADRALSTSNIEFVWSSVVEEVLGDTSGLFPKVTGLRLKSRKDQSIREIELDAMFMAIGHTPNSTFLGDAVEIDAAGYLIVNDKQETNVA
ncbi:MAG: FAD-dependent oxidoreductase, partial [FCB group bacterium]|nr:FAD-dependent oxidoreductase [FCB group bacterium]